MAILLARYVCRTHCLLPLDVERCYAIVRASSRADRDTCDTVLAKHFVITDEGRMPSSGMLILHGGTRLSPAVGVTGSPVQRNGSVTGRVTVGPVTGDVTAAERMRLYRRRKDELHAQALKLGLAPLRGTSKRDLQRMIDEHRQRNAPVTSASLDALRPSRVRADLPEFQIQKTEDKGEPRNTVTPAGAACLAMKAAGMAQVSPSHPRLLSLLQAGVTAEELADVARDCVAIGKGFAYALATVEGRRRDAAAKGAVPARKDWLAEWGGDTLAAKLRGEPT